MTQTPTKRGPQCETLEALCVRLEPAVSYIYAHYTEREIDLIRIAKATCVSPFHFHRLFRKAFGVTPSQMTDLMRIVLAKRKILAGEALIDVARDCGWAHQSHFTNRFTMLVGVTPGRWRDLAKGPV